MFILDDIAGNLLIIFLMFSFKIKFLKALIYVGEKIQKVPYQIKVEPRFLLDLSYT